MQKRSVTKFFMGLLVLTACSASAAAPSAYPSRPLRIVSGAAGGGTDFVARVVADGLSATLGQAVVVDNRASGVLQGALVATAAPDGYTLLVSSGNLWIAKFMEKVPYDAVKDFQPITQAAISPYVMVVYPGVAAKTVGELVALAKAKPGELNYASLGVGSSNHLAAELFKSLAGVNLVRISYKSAAASTIDLVSGQVQVSFLSVTSAGANVKSGRLRALAVTSAQPSALFPGLPTVGATVKGYENAAVTGVFAPAKTSPAIIARVRQAIVNYLNTPAVREKLFVAGVEPVGDTPEQFAAMIKADMARWQNVIQDAGIRAE